MKYKNWNITKIKENVWKADKNGEQINVSSPRLLRALIDENESKVDYGRVLYESKAKASNHSR
jgi:hypothetical protein